MWTTLFGLAIIYIIIAAAYFIYFVVNIRYPVHLCASNDRLRLEIRRTEKPQFGILTALSMAALWWYGPFYLRRKYAGYAWFGPYPCGGGWRRLTSRDLKQSRRSSHS
jgi:hypothetical protein